MSLQSSGLHSSASSESKRKVIQNAVSPDPHPRQTREMHWESITNTFLPQIDLLPALHVMRAEARL